jgi:hypothetical protein
MCYLDFEDRVCDVPWRGGRLPEYLESRSVFFDGSHEVANCMNYHRTCWTSIQARLAYVSSCGATNAGRDKRGIQGAGVAHMAAAREPSRIGGESQHRSSPACPVERHAATSSARPPRGLRT